MYENIILIPYRNREAHLDYFINNSWKLIKDNVNNPRLVIIEQEEGKLFNRGKLLNVGFKEYIDKTKFFITHDVDINPNSSTLTEYNNTYDITSIYTAHNESLGGIIKISNDVLKNINGFPNNIWGWGIEDRALFYRAYIKNVRPVNYNKKYNFKVLHHKSNVETYINEKKKISDIWRKQNIDKLNDEEKNKLVTFSGINNINYTILERKELQENVELIKVKI